LIQIGVENINQQKQRRKENKMGDIKEKLLKVEILKSDDYGIEFKCTIEKELVFNMFSERYFQEQLARQLVARIVKDLPIEYINKVREMISLDSVAKLTTLEMAKSISGQQYR